MLETVGLTADESEVYRLLVATGTASAQDISGRSALDVVTARLPVQPRRGQVEHLEHLALGLGF
ncbi:hypothetical protein ACFVRU_56560, partial [Streptomyces sp. NPDC057927]